MKPRVINILHGHPAYWCPVCDHPHWLDGRWKWNGDLDKPTFGPVSPGAKHSFLSYSSAHTSTWWLLKRNDIFYAGQDESGKSTCTSDESKAVCFFEEQAHQRVEQLKNDNEGLGWGAVKRVRHYPYRVFCHVHVTDGMIRILNDTPGPLSGKTIPLQPWVLSEDGRTYHKPG